MIDNTRVHEILQEYDNVTENETSKAASDCGSAGNATIR